MKILQDTISGRYAIEHEEIWSSKLLDFLWTKGVIGKRAYSIVFEIFVFTHKCLGRVNKEELDI